MQRYFGIEKKDNTLFINKDDFNHIKNVMRFKEDDQVNVVYDKKVYLCKLDKSLESCSIVEELEYIEEEYYLRMYVPILNEDKTDLILQKGTELGVKEFVFVNMERCKYKIDKSKEDKKLLRWSKIVKEAAEQNERNYIPLVKGIINFKDIDNQADKLIICSLDIDNSITLNNMFKNKSNFDIINVVFGPEGGLSLKEENELVEKGYKRVNFGRQILRTETTPIFISSLIKYLYMKEEV